MTPFSLFLLSRKGDKIEVCLAIWHRRFWRSRAKLQIWPWGNLLEWGAVVICLGARINKNNKALWWRPMKKLQRWFWSILEIANVGQVQDLDASVIFLDVQDYDDAGVRWWVWEIIYRRRIWEWFLRELARAWPAMNQRKTWQEDIKEPRGYTFAPTFIQIIY